MNAYAFFMFAAFCGQTPTPAVTSDAAPAPPVPGASAPPATPAPVLPGPTAVPAAPLESAAMPMAPAPTALSGEAPTNYAPNAYATSPAMPPGIPSLLDGQTRGMFQSDHAFDGFTTPLSNPVQSKDPRALTEVRFLYMGDYSRPSTPVIGGGTVQVYAMQLRLALTERLQLFADKDGLAMVSPKGARSRFGMANLAAGAKYVLIRDEENQFLFSGAVQYEAPTGYSNIFEGRGDGLLGVYGIIGKQFLDNWHFVSTFGQNTAMNKSNSSYFMTTAHIDRRFGKFVPFYEANWFYYNQSGNHLVGVGTEGGGWLNLGSSKVVGSNYVTNAVGFNYEFSQHVILGLAYEYQLTSRTMVMNNMLNAQLIFRY